MMRIEEWREVTRILDLAIKWRWVVNFMLLLVSPWQAVFLSLFLSLIPCVQRMEIIEENTLRQGLV